MSGKLSPVTDKKRLLVIGLDGATFALIDQWIESGYLPTLRRLIAEGVRGELKSTIPYQSGPAWVSFATGMNPGKHGVFDFLRRDKATGAVKVNYSSDIGSETMMSVLARHGKKMNVVNLPMTYPPQRLNGYLISSLLTPSLKSTFTYPPGFKDEFLENVKGYMIEPAFSSQDKEKTKRALAENCIPSVERRFEAIRYLMKKNPDWDLSVVVITETDRMQHFFWDDFDVTHPLWHPEKNPQYRDVIFHLYAKIDSLIGQLIGQVGESCQIILLSDHGFAGVHRQFCPNTWLMQEGYLVFKKSSFQTILRAKNFLTRLGIFHYLKKLIRRVYSFEKMMSKIDQSFVDAVDWSKTKVFWTVDNGFTINLKGRNLYGIVEGAEQYEALRDELIGKLSHIREPISNDPIIEKVHKNDDIFHGPYVKRSPDLIVSWKEYPDKRKMYYYDDVDLVCPQVFKEPGLTGNHSQWGLFVAKGRDFKKGHTIYQAEIVDLFPTILYALGLPISKDVDGKILWDAFEQSFVATHRVRHEDDSASKAKGEGEEPETATSEEDDRKIIDRLKSLGYL